MMRILLDQSAHDMRNKGNNALLEVAAARFMKYWPDASFDIVTLAPHITRIYYTWSRPVSPDTLSPFEGKMDRVFRWVPDSLLWLIFELREEWLHRQMAAEKGSWRGKDPSRPENASIQLGSEPTKYADFSSLRSDSDHETFRAAVSSYDLVVASGGGYFCDSDKPRLLRVFDRLDAAVENDVPAVMVGQGIGPLNDHQLQERASQVLPRLDLVCVRERRVALPILKKLGISNEKIRMTGDDAIELAYHARSERIGRGVGLSVRISSYTQINERHIKDFRSILHAFAARYKAPLVAVPISSAPHESDITHIRVLMEGYPHQSAGWRKLNTPLDSIKMAGQCRIMLAGTYHGAIFSLAQGIPVIGLAKSDEYFYKLSGLTDEFGQGCQILHMDDPDLAAKFSRTIEELWSSADELRPDLLQASERQIESGHAAYDQIFRIVSEHRSRFS
jgi:colanic acid/amylovoran biosynthesis protein